MEVAEERTIQKCIVGENKAVHSPTFYWFCTSAFGMKRISAVGLSSPTVILMQMIIVLITTADVKGWNGIPATNTDIIRG